MAAWAPIRAYRPVACKILGHGRDGVRCGIHAKDAVGAVASGHVVALAGTRTYHRLACASKDADFEIRDAIIEFLSADPAGLTLLETLNKNSAQRLVAPADWIGVISATAGCEAASGRVTHYERGSTGQAETNEGIDPRPQFATLRLWHDMISEEAAKFSTRLCRLRKRLVERRGPG